MGSVCFPISFYLFIYLFILRWFLAATGAISAGPSFWKYVVELLQIETAFSINKWIQVSRIRTCAFVDINLHNEEIFVDSAT